MAAWAQHVSGCAYPGQAGAAPLGWLADRAAVPASRGRRAHPGADGWVPLPVPARRHALGSGAYGLPVAPTGVACGNRVGWRCRGAGGLPGRAGSSAERDGARRGTGTGGRPAAPPRPSGAPTPPAAGGRPQHAAAHPRRGAGAPGARRRPPVLGFVHNTPQLTAAGMQGAQEIADALGPYSRWRVTPNGPLGRLLFAFTEFYDPTRPDDTRLRVAAFGGDPHVYTTTLGDTTALCHAGTRRIV